ncbi:MAG: sensor histidine kinase [Chloroflexi bacterium]|nr:sensor histidine kinase [Chloroflexota bacterium]
MSLTERWKPRVLVIRERMWDKLTEPTISVVDFETRLKSRWMAAIFVILVPFGIFIAMVPPLVDHRPPWEDPQVQGVFGLSIFLVVCYFLSRRGHYKLSAVTAISTATLTIYSISLIDNDPGNLVSDATYLIAPVVFGSIMLSQKSTVVLLVINMIGLLLQPFLSPQVSMENILKGPLSLLVMTYALVAFGGYLRNVLEKHHVAMLQTENAERRRAEEHLRASLEEKEILLKEIHHRVKNNLQTISSLLSLQSNTIDDPLTLAQFQDSQNRIRTMALVHERLYRSEGLAQIAFGEYLRDLTDYLLASYQGQEKAVTLNVKADDIFLDIDTAIPCGLLVNELLSNALKHAFRDRLTGKIGVEMCFSGDGHYQLSVWDDGVGMPEGMSDLKTTSLGLRLVNSLTRQLGATIEFRSRPGTEITIRFAKPTKNAFR